MTVLPSTRRPWPPASSVRAARGTRAAAPARSRRTVRSSADSTMRRSSRASRRSTRVPCDSSCARAMDPSSRISPCPPPRSPVAPRAPGRSSRARTRSRRTGRSACVGTRPIGYATPPGRPCRISTRSSSDPSGMRQRGSPSCAPAAWTSRSTSPSRRRPRRAPTRTSRSCCAATPLWRRSPSMPPERRSIARRSAAPSRWRSIAARSRRCTSGSRGRHPGSSLPDRSATTRR